jgi:hypothetical protein
MDDGLVRARSMRLALALACAGFTGACSRPYDTVEGRDRYLRERLVADCVRFHDGCHTETTRVGNATVSVSEWQTMTSAVRNVASFEMSCPQDQLQLVILASTQSSLPTGQKWDSPTQIGVTGCRQRRAYTRFNDKWASGGAAPTDGAPAGSP